MPYTQVTLAQLLVMLQERYESTPFWSSAEATVALNEALLWWNLFTGMWKQRVLINSVAATASNYPTGYIYSLPSTLTFNMRMQWNNTSPLDITSIHDLNQGRPSWHGELAGASGLPAQPTLWAPVGLRRFAIWPADSVGGGSILVDGVAATPQLVLATDFLDLGQAELRAILGEALHISSFKMGGSVFISTARYHKEFVMAAADQNARLRATTFFRRVLGEDKQRWEKGMRNPDLPPILNQLRAADQQQQPPVS